MYSNSPLKNYLRIPEYLTSYKQINKSLGERFPEDDFTKFEEDIFNRLYFVDWKEIDPELLTIDNLRAFRRYYIATKNDLKLLEVLEELRVKGDKRAYFYLGNFYDSRKKPEDAMRYYLLSEQAEPDYVYTCMNLAFLYASLGDKEKEEEYYFKAYKLGFTEALTYIIELYENKLRDEEDGVKRFNDTIMFVEYILEGIKTGHDYSVQYLKKFIDDKEKLYFWITSLNVTNDSLNNLKQYLRRLISDRDINQHAPNPNMTFYIDGLAIGVNNSLEISKINGLPIEEILQK